ncbi:ATP synthase F1 subunit gamma [Mycoplasmopsis felis]|uniref:ATP synthase F1 subunit gamma n=1 Tax=Mycoplasmopsis felis TaxID=33923 RepID=UPI00056B4C63|nr:ATP synthase F1 subunit gamma [Mycoplasmopsis felis]WQQ02517.1 ATP synthase F1 subunit gamma [Mycoplasmopsis felis]WQQ07464.1 ATP synthase F1 subunit gamma [Mycoplasmopsis felis]WQQ08930.1 ATP synthase F1 subunit gamma [Mycoplasmopsis felis]WQQ10428.1 ATP synthase F1 subunit gamma [Mycoplasmopsis felis]WQQ10566.1 ATP synthase F1 subunit gamma [Mycoplasmopsis felis]
MPNLNNLKNRISVVSSTQKITNAMELVSTSKLRRLRNEYTQVKSYLDTLQDTFNELIAHVQPNDFYDIFPQNNIESSLYIVITSDLGLCGSYNSNIIKLLTEKIKQNDKIIILGTKGVGLVLGSSLKDQVIKSYINIGDKLSYKLSNEITKMALEYYTDKKISKINLIYTEFINNLTQTPISLQLFPINVNSYSKTQNQTDSIEFEPNAETVLLETIPMFISSMIYCLSANSKISEMASRRNAMENATSNAGDLIKDLKLEFNRQRQGIITQEITEIVAGADAT